MFPFVYACGDTTFAHSQIGIHMICKWIVSDFIFRKLELICFHTNKNCSLYIFYLILITFLKGPELIFLSLFIVFKYRYVTVTI